MSAIQLKPAQAANGRFVEGVRVLGVTNEATGFAVTLYTTPDLDVPVVYPVTSDVEGAFAAFAAVGGIHLVQFHPEDDRYNIPARWEAIDAEAVATENARIDALEAREGHTDKVYVEQYVESAVYDSDSAAIQAAALAAEIQPRGNLVFANRTYEITDHDADGYGVIFKVARHSIEVQRGTRFDCTAMVAGETAIKMLGGSNTDWGDVNGFGNAASKIELPRIIGPVSPGVDTDGPIGMEIVGTTAGTASARMIFRGGAISGFSHAVIEHSNGYAWTFDGTEIFNCITGFEGADNVSDANANERHVFSRCIFYDNCVDIKQTNHYTDTYCFACSFDYGVLKPGVTPGADPNNPASCKLWAKSGQIFAIGCHFEDTGDTDRWWLTGEPYSAIILQGCKVHLGGNKAANGLEFGYTAQATSGHANRTFWGGITLRDVYFRMRLNYPLTKLIAGNGKVRASNVMHANGEPVGEANWWPAICDSLNLVDGTFESANALARWDLSYTVGASSQPAIDATTAKTGSKSLKFAVPDASGRSQATLWLSVAPGELLHLAMFLKLSGLTAAEKFSLEFKAYDNDPGGGASHLIETVTKEWAADQDWTLWQNPPYTVPSGASYVSVTLFTGGWDSGSQGWVDELVLNAS